MLLFSTCSELLDFEVKETLCFRYYSYLSIIQHLQPLFFQEFALQRDSFIMA